MKSAITNHPTTNKQTSSNNPSLPTHLDSPWCSTDDILTLEPLSQPISPLNKMMETRERLYCPPRYTRTRSRLITGIDTTGGSVKDIPARFTQVKRKLVFKVCLYGQFMW
eukprot:TRINITY_DN966_c0_g1_i2.p1 TRINITY_DN966_c0_g1~~TRINITY_DN966_c0_g1_i2.p1  ORF type:complete len:110 (+),score=9.22 TRINITY_DN966_c0_g1_i2:1-330(+)